MQADVERQSYRQALKSAVAGQQVEDALHAARGLLRIGKAADTAACASAFRSMQEQLVANGHRRLRTYLVRSVTVEPVLPALQVEAVLSGFVLDLQVGGYGSYMEDLLDPASELGRAGADLVLIVLDLQDVAGSLPDLCATGTDTGVESELDLAVARIAQMLRTYRAHHAGRLVLQGLVLPNASSLGPVADANLRYSLGGAVRELNRRLAEVCGTVPDCLFFDVDHVAGQFGRRNWADERMFLASRLPLAPGAFSTYAQALVRTALTLFRPSRKVLCTDLDNTLWGGILGEDGPEGIATGSAYPGNCYLEYQKYLKRLAARGILLAIASKNNPADVDEAFQLRSADLALNLTDFVARKISWGDKTESLRELARELNLGLNAFVFVDDNPAECEAVRQNLPEVAVVMVPPDEPWNLVETLLEEPYFDVSAVTADDVGRTQEYRAQAQRDALSATTATREEFLESLGIVCTFVNALEAPLARSVQLLGKTNQFNVTTRRHSAVEVEHMAHAAGGIAVAIRVRDRFGDAGVVGLALAKQQGDSHVIDSLLLSCRVIGRGIETALLAYVARAAVAMGSRWLIGEYIPSKKNALCAGFYTDHGFETLPSDAEDGTLSYKLDLDRNMPASPSWITLEGKNTHEYTADTAVTA